MFSLRMLSNDFQKENFLFRILNLFTLFLLSADATAHLYKPESAINLQPSLACLFRYNLLSASNRETPGTSTSKRTTFSCNKLPFGTNQRWPGIICLVFFFPCGSAWTSNIQTSFSADVTRTNTDVHSSCSLPRGEMSLCHLSYIMKSFIWCFRDSRTI